MGIELLAGEVSVAILRGLIVLTNQRRVFRTLTNQRPALTHLGVSPAEEDGEDEGEESEDAADDAGNEAEMLLEVEQDHGPAVLGAAGAEHYHHYHHRHHHHHNCQA